MAVALLWLAFSALLASSGTAGTSIGVIQGGELVLEGSTACYATGDVCTFTVSSLDPSLSFYRWDLDGNGAWETPDQTGGGPLGRWTEDHSVSVRPGSPVYDVDALQACVQGWDGASVKFVNGTVVPDGPVLCSMPVANVHLSFQPAHWGEKSQGNWVRVGLSLPPKAATGKVDWSSVTLEGVPVRVVGARCLVGGEGCSDFVLLVDRGALTAALGPGTHTVHLAGLWSGGLLFGLDEVTIK